MGPFLFSCTDWMGSVHMHQLVRIFVNLNVMHTVLLSAGNTDWHKVIWVELAFSTMSRKVSGWIELSLGRSDLWSITSIGSLMCFMEQWYWACPSWRTSNFPAFHDVLHVCWGSCLLGLRTHWGIMHQAMIHSLKHAAVWQWWHFFWIFTLSQVIDEFIQSDSV